LSGLSGENNKAKQNYGGRGGGGGKQNNKIRGKRSSKGDENTYANFWSKFFVTFE
jgi:hypothetical protein